MNHPIRRVALASMAIFAALLLNISAGYLIRTDRSHRMQGSRSGEEGRRFPGPAHRLPTPCSDNQARQVSHSGSQADQSCPPGTSYTVDRDRR